MNVQPVEGFYLNCAPPIPMTVDDEIGARLVRTGAFTEGGDGGAVPDGVEFTGLNFYDPPPESDPIQPEGPPDGGPPDSPEV